MPLTSVRPVSLVVTEMAVIEPTPEGLVLRSVERGSRSPTSSARPPPN